MGLFEPKRNIFWIWYIRPFLFFDTPYLLKNIAINYLRNRKYRHKITVFWSTVIISVSLLGGWAGLQILALYWLVPLLWVYPALIFWSETGEHYGAQGGNTRNTHGFLEWLAISPYNDRFHFVHHHYPSIPWYNMEIASSLLFSKEEIPRSHGFTDLYRQVRQKALLNAA